MSDISLPLGAKGSGRARYAAAMEVYRHGKIGPEVLEIYRISSALDAQNPGVAVPCPPTGEDLLLRLIDEADRYVASLPGPGTAEVRAGVNRWRSGAVTLRPQTDPVVAAHLGNALAALSKTHLALAQAIADASPHLNWQKFDQYPIDDIGEYFTAGHAFASLIGEDAVIPATDFDFGLFLMAPHLLYRDHHHAAPELYAPLTGPHGWRFGTGAPLIHKPAHAPVWNHPLRPHLTKVGPLPFLCIYGWTKDVNAPAKVLPAADWAELEALRLG